MNDDRIEQLLTQILDTQRAHLEEYKKVAAQSLEMQRGAVETQTRHVILYRRVIAVTTVVIVGLLAYALWLSRLIG